MGVRAALTGWLGAQAGGWSAALVVAVEIVTLWLAFRAVAMAVVGLFAEDIVAAVEARHYPKALDTARPVPLARGIAMGLGSAGRVVAINLVLLPVYIGLLVTGVGTAAMFLLVNGWLLSRDLGDMVAARHMDAGAMRRWRKATGPQRLLLGLAVAVLFVVPGLNLLAPVWRQHGDAFLPSEATGMTTFWRRYALLLLPLATAGCTVPQTAAPVRGMAPVPVPYTSVGLERVLGEDAAGLTKLFGAADADVREGQHASCNIRASSASSTPISIPRTGASRASPISTRANPMAARSTARAVSRR